jgi:DNA-directed RNA polymerase subunit RPC12/RpoP
VYIWLIWGGARGDLRDNRAALLHGLKPRGFRAENFYEMLVDPDALDSVVCPKCGGKLDWKDKDPVPESQRSEKRSPEDELEEDYSEEAACLQCSMYFSATPTLAMKVRVDES